MKREALNYASFGYLVTVSQYGELTTAKPFGRLTNAERFAKRFQAVSSSVKIWFDGQLIRQYFRDIAGEQITIKTI